MTAAQKRQLTVGVLTTIIGTSVLAIIGWGSQTVIFRPEFEARAISLESQVQVVERRIENKLDRVLDVVCDKEPTKPRACGEQD